VVFILFSNFGFKYCFLPVSIHLFLFGDCFQQRVFIYNCLLFHSLHIYFIPSLSHSHHWTRESHDNHSTEGVSTRESHQEPPLRATATPHKSNPNRNPQKPTAKTHIQASRFNKTPSTSTHQQHKKSTANQTLANRPTTNQTPNKKQNPRAGRRPMAGWDPL
jgi:hypothetical protein